MAIEQVLELGAFVYGWYQGIDQTLNFSCYLTNYNTKRKYANLFLLSQTDSLNLENSSMKRNEEDYYDPLFLQLVLDQHEANFERLNKFFPNGSFLGSGVRPSFDNRINYEKAFINFRMRIRGFVQEELGFPFDSNLPF